MGTGSEVDENGRHFVLASDGTTIYGLISNKTGLTPAPIKLSLGESRIDKNGHSEGYGLLHIEDNHGKQIRKAGFSSVEEFVETVAKNYMTIRKGLTIGNKQTYLLELSGNYNETLFVQLSKDGSYWNVNSAGIFRRKYSRRKLEVSSLPEVGSDSITEVTEVNCNHSKGDVAANENSSKTSGDKGKTKE